MLISKNGEAEPALQSTRCRESCGWGFGAALYGSGHQAAGEGGGVLARPVHLGCSRPRPGAATLHTAQLRHLGPKRVHSAPAPPSEQLSVGVGAAISNQELRSKVPKARPLPAVPCETRLSTEKKKKKKVRLYYLY